MATDAFRCDVFSAGQLARLAAAPLPLGIVASRAVRTLHRDLHLDTADGTLARRGVACRLRVSADDRHVLTVRIDGLDGGEGGQPTRIDAPVRSAEPAEALRESTPAGRRLRAVVDPALLEVRVALEVERLARTAHADWLRRPRVVLHYDRVTVRRDRASRDFHQLCVHRLRGRDDAVARLALAFQQEHGLRLLEASRRERAELLLKWMQAEEPGPVGVASDAWPARDDPASQPAAGEGGGEGGTGRLNAEVSLLAFQERVLALAEDAATPLAERLRFLDIVSANVDEFFAVRVAGLKMAAQECAEERDDHEMTAAGQLAMLAPRVASLAARQERCARDCVAALAAHGVRVRAWAELDDGERRTLRARFREEIYPALTPMAMTLSPGHPFPRLPHLSLSIAAVVLDRNGGTPRFTEIELPPTLPRLLQLPGGGAVPLEEVVRGNLDALAPHGRVDQAYLFRVTRGGDLHVDEARADDLLEAVDAAARRRPHNAVVRVEVERGMPPVLRDLVLDELRREPGGDGLALDADDVYELAGPYDLRCLGALDLPERVPSYPAFTPRPLVVAEASLLDAIEAGDLLAHHPFDSFADSVVRFLREAATDPDVVAIKATLYRVGDHSPVIDALRKAAKRGKQVVAFVELRARFDEERNVGWVRALADAGVHVAYGFVGVKTHAKVALVVRRDGERLRRIVHVGTGNYNARSGLHYTDLSLFSADPELAADVGELFNALTGSSAPPAALSHGALVAPGQLLPALLDLVEREAAHARAGRPARIALKVNGLSDPAIVRALERASQDGATVELLVRGVCTLRPGVPGRTERVRVLATAGRFLEHARVYHFANGGDDAWYVGSADLRPRNLRRRVELLVPVRDARCRAELARLLDVYRDDARAWELTAAGSYVRRERRGPGAQELLLGELRALD